MSTSLTDTQSLLTPQQRHDQNVLRAIGRQVIQQFPPVSYAFSYGSSAMPQFDQITQQGESLDSMLKSIDYKTGEKMFDLVLAVENIDAWHDQNINIMNNNSHYSLFGKSSVFRGVFFGGANTNLVQYHPNVPIVIQDKNLLDAGVPEVINVKYGVTTMDTLVTDCINWSSLYLSGRLHKPVTIIQDNPIVSLSRELNLHHAVVYSLLQLPEQFTELELYSKIAQISYHGDIRTSKLVKGEDPKKVLKIIKGSLPFFRELYGGILTTYLNGATTVKIKGGNHNNNGNNGQNDNNNNNTKIPLYDYLNVPIDLDQQIHGKVNNNYNGNNTLPVLRNYNDIYSQINNVAPENVIFSQPNTDQHRAMLLASLPSNTYIHRSGGTNYLSSQHKEKQDQFDDAINKKNQTKESSKDARNDGSDQAGIKAPGIHSRSSDDMGENGKGTRPLTYQSPVDPIEKQIPVLPACLSLLPYSTFTFSFGPEVLTSIYASISPYVKFDREKALIEDKHKLKNLLLQNSSTINDFLNQKKNQHKKLQLSDGNNDNFGSNNNNKNIGYQSKQMGVNNNNNNNNNPVHQSKQTFSTTMRRTLSTVKYLNNIDQGIDVENIGKLNTRNIKKIKNVTNFNNVQNKQKMNFTTVQSSNTDNNATTATQSQQDAPEKSETTKTTTSSSATSSNNDDDNNIIDLELAHNETDINLGPSGQINTTKTTGNTEDLLSAQHQQSQQRQQHKKVLKTIGSAGTVRKLQVDGDSDGDNDDDDDVKKINHQTKSKQSQSQSPSQTVSNNNATTSSSQQHSTPPPTQPNQFLKHGTDTLKRQHVDLNTKFNTTNTTIPSSTNTNTTSPGSSSSTSNRLGSMNGLYTTTVSDILSIEETLETPQQHTAHLISTRLLRQHHLLQKDKLTPDPSNPTSALAAVVNRKGLSGVMKGAMDSIDIPNEIPKKLVLPTITPLPITAAITNDTDLKLMNVSTATDTAVRAVELDMPMVAGDDDDNNNNNKSNKNNKNVNSSTKTSLDGKVPMFVGWNKFTSNSNVAISRGLPMVGADPEFLDEQNKVRKLQSESTSAVVKERVEKRQVLADMTRKISQLKTEVQADTKLLEDSTKNNNNNTSNAESKDGVGQNSSKMNKDDVSLAIIEEKLATIDQLQTAVNNLNSQLSDRTVTNTATYTNLQRYIEPKLPGIWKGLEERSLVDQLSVISNKVTKTGSFMHNIYQLIRLKPNMAALKDGLMIQHPETQMIEVTAYKNSEYFAEMFMLPNYHKQVKVIGAANYALNTVPRVGLNDVSDISSDNGGKKINSQGDEKLIFATAGLSLPPSSSYDREKIQSDPWYYDRKTLPRFDDEKHTAVVEVIGQVKAGALPEGGLNLFNDRRQRWQVNSMLNDEMQENEIRRLGLKLNNNGNNNDQNNDKNNLDNNNLLNAYKTQLQSKFMNVNAAKYDPRQYIAGVARFDNVINALQVIFTTKFPLFGSNILSAQLRHDMLPIWRHDLSNNGNNNNITDDNKNITFPFNQLVNPTTSVIGIKTFVTDNEVLNTLNSINNNNNGNNVDINNIKKTQSIKLVQDNSIKGKNMEWINTVYEWEKVLGGEYNANFDGNNKNGNHEHKPLDIVVNHIIRNRTESIVRKSSLRQTIAGFFSAGPVKSIKYVVRKLQKGRQSNNNNKNNTHSTSTKNTPPSSQSPINMNKKAFSTMGNNHNNMNKIANNKKSSSLRTNLTKKKSFKSKRSKY